MTLCVGCMLVLPTRLRAEPKFTDPDVTAYVNALGEFRDRYMVAVTAAQHGDPRALKRMDAEFPRLQEQAIRLLDKVQPAETKRYTEYVAQCGQAMVDAAYGLGLVHAN